MSTSTHSGAFACAIATRRPGSSSRRLGEHACELLQRLLPAAHPCHGHDLALVDGEDRLDVEQRPRERLRAADAAALLQVLERADREDDADVALEPRHEPLDLVGVVPRASRRWIASASSAQASDAVSVSIDTTRPPPSSAPASDADWNVPESFAERWIE